jgi:hypothetical protein
MVLLCGVGDKEDALVEEEKPRKTNSSWPRVASLAECSPGVTLLALINSSSSSFLRELGLAHTVSPPNSRWRRLGFLYLLLSGSTITRSATCNVASPLSFFLEKPPDPLDTPEL